MHQLILDHAITKTPKVDQIKSVIKIYAGYLFNKELYSKLANLKLFRVLQTIFGFSFNIGIPCKINQNNLTQQDLLFYCYIYIPRAKTEIIYGYLLLQAINSGMLEERLSKRPNIFNYIFITHLVSLAFLLSLSCCFSLTH